MAANGTDKDDSYVSSKGGRNVSQSPVPKFGRGNLLSGEDIVAPRPNGGKLLMGHFSEPCSSHEVVESLSLSSKLSKSKKSSQRVDPQLRQLEKKIAPLVVRINGS